jgi:short subunit dehydrogenase-like uncharacterized protein
MSEVRPYDVVLFGATGFTGRLVAEALARRSRETPLRFALAGRNTEKLEAVLAALETRGLASGRVGLIEADAGDADSLLRMAAKGRVLVSTVGPYLQTGLPVVAACVQASTDYADITGEPAFVAETIERFHDAARAAGVRVVSCCGFDSMPHDLGVLFTVDRLASTGAIEVEGRVRTRGTFSGGTIHTALEIFSQPLRTGPTALDRHPAPASGRRVRSAALGIRRLPGKGWLVPMPTIDPKIVLRSARFDARYGTDFRYAHFLQLGSLPAVLAAGVGVGLFLGLAQLSPTRHLLQKIREPGDGPSQAARDRSWFQLRFVGRSRGRTVVTEVRGGDPGYTETSKMLAEAALCLAFDRERLPERAGVLTPAAAMGAPLIERLRAVGIVFEEVTPDAA